ncbi:MAG: FtsB family cell division protein [Halanaerobiaceae bacterium]
MNRKKKILLLIMTVILFFAGIRFYRNARRIGKLNNHVEILETNIEEARRENRELKQRLERLDEGDYIEREAREKLGLVKPGEVLLIPLEEKKEQEMEEN